MKISINWLDLHELQIKIEARTYKRNKFYRRNDFKKFIDIKKIKKRGDKK